MNRILLSICVPTYNRALYLDISLNRIFQAIKGFEDKVEIIISDNNSIDYTQDVIKKYSKKYKFRSYKNETNIGLNYNLLHLIDKCASGKYCWLVGDDDFIYLNSLQILIPILETNKFDFINFEFDYVSNTEDIQYKTHCSNIKENISCSFEMLTSYSTNPGNILFTFISANIFKLDLIKDVNKSNISQDLWKNIESLFPLSYIYSSVMKNNKSIYLPYSLLTTVIHHKEWNWGLYLLSLSYLPNLLEKYINEGFNKKYILESKKIIIKIGLLNVFQFDKVDMNIIKAKVQFLKRYIFDPLLYKELVKLLVEKSKKMLKYAR